MENSKKEITAVSTIYFIRSNTKPNYIRAFKTDHTGLKEITNHISKILNIETSGMYLIGPKKDTIETVAKLIKETCGKLMMYEDLG
jgi:hypothetical protein